MIDAPHILVVDDDARLRDLLGKFFRDSGFLVSLASDVSDARKKMQLIHFDLVILDLMMPGESGLDFLQELRNNDDIPILMLTAMGEYEDRIIGLETGADDYMSKPFEPRELLLRVHNILRRASKESINIAEEVLLGSVRFVIKRGELFRDGRSVRLTELEMKLLSVLAKRAEQVVTRERLIELTNALGGCRAIDVQVTRLRRKIEENPKVPRYLQTVRGKGYVLRPD